MNGFRVACESYSLAGVAGGDGREVNAMTETSESTAAQKRMVYQRKIFINPPVTRQWVSIKVFSLPADVDDHSALAAMIGHVRYRDSYAGTGDADMVDKHGPYWLSAINPETFIVADPAAADTLIRTWAQYYVPWSPADREVLDREVYARIQRATVIYQLPDIRASAQHDWGDVLASDGFHEFVVIDRAAGELALIVASDD
jgi:hypothetical protein